MSRWLGKAVDNGYRWGALTGEEIHQLLDAGLLVAPPAPPPEVTFRAKAYASARFDIPDGVVAAYADFANATQGKGFRPGAELEVTVRQVGA